MDYRCAVLDDYQNVAMELADWSAVADRLDITIFNDGFDDEAETIASLKDFDIVCAMRERTAFTANVLDGLPKLKLIVTTGSRNAAIDMAAAKQRGIVVCGTDGQASPTVELTFALLLEAARGAGVESARMHAGQPWQTALGTGLAGKTLGVIGLGRLGAEVARIAKVFGMTVVAWSQNLSQERCREIGVDYASKDELFASSDFVSIHLKLSERTTGLVGADDLARMKPTAILVNTSRGPIVDEQALLDALSRRTIRCAALDVYDHEPLPLDHKLRGMDNVVLSPHLGYVTDDNLRVFYGQTVEDLSAWLDGRPIRLID